MDGGLVVRGLKHGGHGRRAANEGSPLRGTQVLYSPQGYGTHAKYSAVLHTLQVSDQHSQGATVTFLNS